MKQACSKGIVVSGVQILVQGSVGRSRLLGNLAGMGETKMKLTCSGGILWCLACRITVESYHVTQHEDHCETSMQQKYCGVWHAEPPRGKLLCDTAMKTTVKQACRRGTMGSLTCRTTPCIDTEWHSNENYHAALQQRYFGVWHAEPLWAAAAPSST